VKWDTATSTRERLQVYGEWGTLYDAKTIRNSRIIAWKADDSAPAAKKYNCHGYSFFGSTAPNGPFLIGDPDSAATILRDGYYAIPAGHARAGDVLVWTRGPYAHSCVIVKAVPKTTPNGLKLDGALDENLTKVNSKNGGLPLRENVSLKSIVDFYEPTLGRGYGCYARRK
jgi:hypothetical protein